MILIGQASFLEADLQEGIRHVLTEARAERNFEIFDVTYGAFGIAEAHFLRDLLSKTSAASDGRLVVVGIAKATIDAQNALLKVLEDLPPGNTFVLVTNDIGNFLPTLRSRLLPVSEKTFSAGQIDTQKFLSLEPVARLQMLKTYFVHAETPEEKSDRMEEVREFLGNLERELYDRKIFYTHADIANTIYSFKRELRGTAPSVRLLLEHLSFFVPKVPLK